MRPKQSEILKIRKELLNPTSHRLDGTLPLQYQVESSESSEEDPDAAEESEPAPEEENK